MPEVGLSAGIISLGEAGNLGDDLILISVADSLYASDQTSSVRFLSHGDSLDWSSIKKSMDWQTIPEPQLVRNRAGRVERRSLLKGCDFVVFGGGGLFQDVHDPMRPYQWVSHIPSGVPVLGLGLGLGPLSERSVKFLSSLPSLFSEMYVRDDQSRILASEIGWVSERAEDCVTAELLDRLADHVGRSEGSLGVALREWPGLAAAEVAEWIEQVAQLKGCSVVHAFVLEATDGEGADVEFTRAVLNLVNIPSRLSIYQPLELQAFLGEMRSCRSAVSMKLHSSAIWGYMGVEIYPITYAPKTSALFGVPWSGLEIIKTPQKPILLEAQVISSREALTDWVRRWPHRSPGPAIRQPYDSLLSAANFANLVRAKINRVARSTFLRAQRNRPVA